MAGGRAFRQRHRCRRKGQRRRCQLRERIAPYATSICSLCDQGSDQRKAVGELHDQQQNSDATLMELSYHQNTLGALHGCKNTIAEMRNYRVCDARGEFSISVLRAIICSDSALAAELATNIRNDVVLCRDRHSDWIAFLTCYEPVRAVLRTCRYVKVQLVPEPYIHWHPRTEYHSLLQRPGCVVANSRGEVLVVDLEKHIILKVSRNVPAKVKSIVGREGPGRATTDEGSSTYTSYPMQLALLVVKPGSEEYCLFVDSGNRLIRLVSGVHAFDATVTVETLFLDTAAFTPPLQPYGLALVSSSVLAASDRANRRVLITTLDLGRKLLELLTVLSWGAADGLVGPTCLAALEGMLYVADTSAVRCIPLAVGQRRGAARDLTSTRSAIRTLPHTFQELHGIAATMNEDGSHQVAVADRTSHKITILAGAGAWRTLLTPVAARRSCEATQ